MRHARPIWIAFALAALAVFAAMAWITAAVVRLDAAEAESRQRAQLEENVRLALWRMDSALAPLIAAEHARPHAAFRPRPAAPAGKGAKGHDLAAGGDMMMSDWLDAPPPPLPGESASFVRLYFQFAPDGTLTSPQPVSAASGNQPDDLSALTRVAPASRLFAALPPAGGMAMNDVVTLLNAPNALNNAPPVLPPSANPTPPLPQSVAPPQQIAQAPQGDTGFNANQQTARQELPLEQLQQQADVPNQQPAQAWQPQQLAQAKQQRDEVAQSRRNRIEYQARSANTSIQYQLQNAYNGGNFDVSNGTVVPIGSAPAVMHAVWCGPRNDELVLARRVGSDGGDAVQGCWVDWPAVRNWLLKGSADLLPGATLQPVNEAAAAAPGDVRLLASLPVRLVPGALAADANGSASPLRISLVVAWACVLLASAAVAGLLRGIVSLSERRGAFVSAVTHELRTPLTTLRMYTEMLEGGMVEDEAQRRTYLGTLRAEADRLGHLVDNVLAYSRLERNRATSSESVVSTLDDLLRRPIDRLAERARQAGMTLQVDLPGGVASTRVRANPTSLEQILFNLVDNACKYANGSGGDATIHLSAAHDGDVVTLTVRDHGPGLSAGREGRLFAPFSKSVQEAANTAPGLGLGLALSKRLAAAMGGKLSLDARCTDGACFVLTLPTA